MTKKEPKVKKDPRVDEAKKLRAGSKTCPWIVAPLPDWFYKESKN